MKAKIFILPLLIATAIACGKEVVDNKNETVPQPIDFVSPMTRNGAITTPEGVAAAGGFHVWGFSHSGAWLPYGTYSADIFNNTPVTGNVPYDMSWSYGEPKTWPTGYFVSFFSYAPGSDTGVTVLQSGTSLPEVAYTVNPLPSQQMDFLIATPRLNRIGPLPVVMTFSHALSRIRFSAVTSAGIADMVKIVRIEITNVYSEGETSLQTPVVWENLATTATYTLTSGAELIDGTINTTAKIISTDTGTPMLMPQGLRRDADQPQIIVTFDILGDMLTYVIPEIPSTEWLPGNTYQYRLQIDDDYTVVAIICGNLEPTTPGTWGDF